jgi:hypothetical protein
MGKLKVKKALITPAFLRGHHPAIFSDAFSRFKALILFA